MDNLDTIIDDTIIGLNENTVSDALNIDSHGQAVGRALINGAVVIYDLYNAPAWLSPILRMRDENGDVRTAIIKSGEMFETVEFSMNITADPRKDNSKRKGD